MDPEQPKVVKFLVYDMADDEFEELEMDEQSYKDMCAMEEEEAQKSKERRQERRRLEDSSWMFADD